MITMHVAVAPCREGQGSGAGTRPGRARRWLASQLLLTRGFCWSPPGKRSFLSTLFSHLQVSSFDSLEEEYAARVGSCTSSALAASVCGST